MAVQLKRDGASASSPPRTRPSGRPFIRTAHALIALLALIAASILAAPEAAAADRSSHTDWHVNDYPELSGPKRYWRDCESGMGWGDNNCVYTGAAPWQPQATNCATWNMGLRAGEQTVLVHVPYKHATAETPYRINVYDYYTGEYIWYAKWLKQGDPGGWTELSTIDFGLSRVVISSCDNKATSTGWIGIDAIAMRCVNDCAPPNGATPRNVQASVFDGNQVMVTWDSGSTWQFPHEEFRVRYSRPPLVDHHEYGSRKEWTSEAYRAYSHVHYSPPLWSGVTYTVEVWAVDIFGRITESATASITNHPPPCGLGPYDFLDSELADLTEYNKVMAGVRDGLDVLGTLDPTPLSDGSSAVLSAMLGDNDEMWISIISMAPYIGDISKAGKAGKRFKQVLSKSKSLRDKAIRKYDNPTRNLPNFRKADIVAKLDIYSSFVRRTKHRYRGVDNLYDYFTDGYGRVHKVVGKLKRQTLDYPSDYMNEVGDLVRKTGKKGDTNGTHYS